MISFYHYQVGLHEHIHNNVRKVNEFSCKPEPIFVAAAPAKRSTEQAVKSPSSGGSYQDVSIDDEQVKEMATFATTALASETNTGPVKLLNIIKAEKQVVAGVNYKMTIEIGSVDKNDEHQLCEVVIFDQPWTNTRKLSESKCGGKKKF